MRWWDQLEEKKDEAENARNNGRGKRALYRMVTSQRKKRGGVQYKEKNPR